MPEVERVDWIFNDDVREKKKLANQARYRKRGSKSKKCNLSSDRLTHKQWLERCGKTVTYNFRKPIMWQDFCELPIHIQKEYLLNLIDEYQTTASDLAKMFGITPQTVTKHCGHEEIGIRFSPGKRMSKEKRKAFEEFCGVVAPQEEVVVAKKEQEPVKTEAFIDLDNATQSPDMAMTEFTLSFSGNFNREMICNSLASMLPKGAPVKLDIKCLVML